MWKRNLSIGLTAILIALSAVVGVTNIKQQKRIDELEALRSTTTEQVEAEIAKYLSLNGIDLINDAAEEGGIDINSMIEAAINDLIGDNKDGNITVFLDEDQIKAIAEEVANSTYDSLTDEVLEGEATIDTAQLENEVASAVTNAITEYVQTLQADYVTVEGDTDAIVAEVLSKITLPSQTASDKTNANSVSMTEEEITALVKSIVTGTYMTTDTVSGYEDEVVNKVVDYLIKNKLLVEAVDGEDGYTPVKGTDYFTDSDILVLKEDIAQALKSSTGLAIYGTKGTGIGSVELDDDGNFVIDLVSEVYDSTTGTVHDEVSDTLTIENVAGNSVVAMRTMQVTDTVYAVVYYTRYKTATNDAGVPCYVSGTEFKEIEEESAQAHLALYPDDKIVYRYEAGTINVDAETIADYVTTAMDTLIDSLQAQLGDSSSTVQASIDALQSDIDYITNYINGGIVDVYDANGNKIGTTTVDGLDILTTTDNGSSSYEGSFAWLLQQVNKGVNDVSYAEDLEALVSDDLGAYATKSDIVAVTIPSTFTKESGYNVIDISFKSYNSRPDFTLVGSPTSDLVVPTNKMAEIFSYCKFLKIKVDKTTGDATCRLYFVDSSDAALSNYAGEKIYLEFTQTGIKSVDASAILMNQTHNNYGTVRVADDTNGTVKITGPYVENFSTDEELKIDK